MIILNNSLKGIYYCFGLFLLLIGSTCFAQTTVVITGQKVINTPTAYRNVILDLSNGSFLITNNAILELDNTTVNGTISQDNPHLIKVLTGRLVLRKNQFNLTAGDIQPDPTRPAPFNAIKVSQGKVYIVGNNFTVDKTHTVGLLSTDHLATSGFIINNNTVHNFHGGIFLSNSSNAVISTNSFSNVSLSNIFTAQGNNNLFKRNTILFSGNNGMDIIDSDNITLSENYISLSNCYSVFILRSQNVLIDSNQIIGGITYAIYAAPSIGTNGIYDRHLIPFVDMNYQSADMYKNSNLTITNNYLGQNRYGLAATSVDGLIVQNNTFIQKFNDSFRRKFWTNNDALLQNTIHVSWSNNFYKEAFTQLASGNNENAGKLVSFPPHGGVIFQ